MARLQTGRRKKDRWRAAVKLNYVEYYLGTFDTKEEACAREEEFRRESVQGR